MDGFITHSEDIPRSMDEKTTQSIQKHHVSTYIILLAINMITITLLFFD